MHKYQPRIHIVKKKDSSSIQNLDAEEFRTFIFPESTFIAVTAYQNQLVSRLQNVHINIYIIDLSINTAFCCSKIAEVE